MDYIVIYEIWHLRQFNRQKIALIVILRFISLFTLKNKSNIIFFFFHFGMLKGPYSSHFQIYQIKFGWSTSYNKHGLFG